MSEFKTTETGANKFTNILNWDAKNLTAEDILDLNIPDKHYELADIKKAYKVKALKFHPDKNPNDEILAERAFKLTTAAYKYLLFKYYNDEFLQNFGISEIDDNPFYLKYMPKSSAGFPSAIDSDWAEFFNGVISDNLNIELFNILLTQHRNEFKIKLGLHLSKRNFLKFIELLKSANDDHITNNLKFFFELTDHREYFIRFIEKNFNITDEEILAHIKTNNVLARHFELFIPRYSATDKLKFAIQIVKQSPGAYRFLSFEHATNLEIITHAFKHSENAALLDNLLHLRSSQDSENGTARNIFYAIVNKFAHIRDYKDLNKAFAGPREPYYTYLKCIAAACPLIIGGTALLILYVGALQAVPALALLACFPATISTAFAAFFTYDYIIIKSYEYQISKILRENNTVVDEYQEDTKSSLQMC